MTSFHWPTGVKGSYWSKTVQSFELSIGGEKFLLINEIFSLVYDEWKAPFINKMKNFHWSKRVESFSLLRDEKLLLVYE